MTLIGLIVLCGWAAVRSTRPPAPLPATAPDTVFSAARALRHVAAIAQRPHPPGTADHARVRDYIIDQLTKLGVKPDVQSTTAIGTRYQQAGHVENIVATLAGRAPNGHSLLIAAHYDGVGAGPAASDDGAGSAALLETFRALRARKTPLAHDVVFLFTDGEEAGLLGAAAFVRENPLAHAVSFALNFEARGTTGRSYMFETGPGNLDAVRLLRAAPDVTAGSVFTTVYRTLPNDTDLSELSQLGIPAMNFAFAQGVERYHTSRDDVERLNPGSLQHHGMQMLALAKVLGDGDLPRPTTGDAVFFDMPLLGLVIYPTWLAIPLMLVALVMTFVVVRPMWRGAFGGAAIMLLSTVVVGLIARSINLVGPARWNGTYVVAIALCVVGITVEAHRMIKRWLPDAFAGALLIWMLLAAVTSVKVPGVSYLFTWPLLFALIAARSRNVIAQWMAAAMTILILGGVTYVAAAVMLGLAGAGAIALAVLVSLIAWLLLPTLEQTTLQSRTSSLKLFFVPAALVVGFAVLTVHPDADHPTPTALTYVENADNGEAWFGAYGRQGKWVRSAIGAMNEAPAWTSNANQYGVGLFGRTVDRAALEAPTATVVGDSTTGGIRHLVVRIVAPNAIEVLMRATGAHVLSSAIDGRAVDTTRYRHQFPAWSLAFAAVPDSGALIGLNIAAGEHVDFDIAARRPGLPVMRGVTIPPRPTDVVPAQDGDMSVVVRRVHF